VIDVFVFMIKFTLS